MDSLAILIGAVVVMAGVAWLVLCPDSDQRHPSPSPEPAGDEHASNP